MLFAGKGSSWTEEGRTITDGLEFWDVVSDEYRTAAGVCMLLPLAGCDACCLVGCRRADGHGTVDD